MLHCGHPNAHPSGLQISVYILALNESLTILISYSSSQTSINYINKLPELLGVFVSQVFDSDIDRELLSFMHSIYGKQTTHMHEQTTKLALYDIVMLINALASQK